MMSSNFTFAVRFVQSLIFVLFLILFFFIVLVVIVGRRVVLHESIEALESLHNIVHIHIELACLVIFGSR